MKKTIQSLMLVMMIAGIFAFNNANAQVTVTATLGQTGPDVYTTLKTAFDSINVGRHKGVITIDINGNTTETATASLNASGTGAASYTSVGITPSGGSRTITGSIVGAIIKLNGADNVTIDGRIAGTGRNLNVTNSSTATATAAIWLASVAVGNGASGNTVRNCNLSCGVDQTTSTSSTYGIIMCGTTISTTSNGDDNDNNSFLSNSIIKCRYGIVTRGVTTSNNVNITVSGNIVGPSAFGSDQIGKDGIFMQADSMSTVTNNIVQFVGVLVSQTAAGADRLGIAIGTDAWTSTTTTTLTSSNYTVTGNIVHDIIEEKTFSSVGMLIATTRSGPATNNLIANNSIYNIRANATPSDQCIGLGHIGNRGDKIVFNSISMTGDLDPASSSATMNPVAVGISMHLGAAGDTAVTVKDNSILMNLTSNTATLLKVCMQTISPTYAWGSGGMNNNDYFIPDTTNHKIGLATTGTSPTYGTLAIWKLVYTPAQDGASISSDPLYSSNTSNLQPGIGSPLVAAGAPISGVTTDILGVTRSVTTPTIGAYESAADVIGPAISYTALTNTTSTSNRSFTPVTITDASGVNGTSGTSPRVYYKKSTSPNTSGGWVHTEATGTSPFSFTIDNSLLGGVSTSDVIQYFVVAQDLSATPNVSINSGTFAATPSSVALTGAAFPITGTINSYIIVGAPLSGDYTIGVLAFNRASGKNITMERVVKKVMKEVFVADETTDNVKSTEIKESASQYAGSGKMVMQEVEEVSFIPMENGKEFTQPLYVKRTEKPELPTDAGAGVYATITAAVNDMNARGINGPVRLLLLDATYPNETYPIIVESVSGASSTNIITLKPNAGVTTSVIGSSSANPLIRVKSSYFTIDGSNTVSGTTRDLTLENTSTTTPQVVQVTSTGTTPVTNSGIKNSILRNGVNTSSAIVLNDIGGALAGYFNNIAIENNDVQKAYNGIFCNLISVAGNGTGLNVSKNTLTTSGANAIRFVGIAVQGADGATISQNEIANLETTSSEDDKGIWLAAGSTNCTIDRNYIHDLVYTGINGYGGHGIAVSTTITNANVTVSNNMIANVAGDGWSYTSIPTDNPIGINLFGSVGQSGIKVYFNSINMYGNTINQTSGMSMGMYLAAASVADIRNNSIVNNQGLTAAIGYGSVGIYAVTSNAQFATIDYNNYYVNPTGSGLKYVGQIASTGSVDLAAWKTATGQDVNSQSGNPQYQSNTNLHVSLATNSILNNNGVAGTGVTVDIDGNPRSVSKPDIGCDEFVGAYVLNLTAANQYCPTYNYTVELFDAGYVSQGTAAATFTDNATSVNLVFSGINNLKAAFFSITGSNTLQVYGNVTAITPSDASSITYNMTTAQTQEAGGNLKFNPNSVWAIPTGDVNQDGTVDASDLAAVENDIDCAAPGCQSGYPTDLNCDGDYVDAFDLSVVENNQGLISTPPVTNYGTPDHPITVKPGSQE